VAQSGDDEADVSYKRARLHDSEGSSSSSCEPHILKGSGPTVQNNRDSGPERKLGSAKGSGFDLGSGSRV
jgi:hypothetical protein